jgi:hypothetical protein
MRKIIQLVSAFALFGWLGAGAILAQEKTQEEQDVAMVEGIALAKGQPLIFAKRVAWLDAMRNLAEQALGVEFVLDPQRPSSIRYTVRGDVAPAGRAEQVSAETLPTGIYRIKLRVEVEPPPPPVGSLPEITAEGKADLAANRNAATARQAAKANAMAEAIKNVAAEESARSGRPIPHRLEGHAYYLGPVSERIEGNFYYVTAKFKIALTQVRQF